MKRDIIWNTMQTKRLQCGSGTNHEQCSLQNAYGQYSLVDGFNTKTSTRKGCTVTTGYGLYPLKQRPTKVSTSVCIWGVSKGQMSVKEAPYGKFRSEKKKKKKEPQCYLVHWWRGV